MLEINPLAKQYGAVRPSIVLEQADRRRDAETPTRFQPDADTAEVIEVTGGQTADAGPRDGLVARVRAEIQAGTYLTPERIDSAIDRLFGALSSDE
jgi:hypothetical protein